MPCAKVKCFAVRNDRLYAGATNAISVFDLVSQTVLTTHAVRGNVACVTLAENCGQYSNASSNSTTVDIEGNVVVNASGEGSVWLIAAIDVSDSQHEIFVYNTSDFSVLACLKGHNYFITSMHVFNNKLYSNSRDNNMLIYDLSTFESVRENKYVVSGYRDLCVSNCRLFTVHSKYPAVVQINLL